MQWHTAVKCFGVFMLSSSPFWFAFCADIIQGRLKQVLPFTCDNAAVCATSEPARTLFVRSKGQCAVECQLLRDSCVGVNFLQMNNACEIFSSNPTNASQTVAGCQYMQVNDLNWCHSMNGLSWPRNAEGCHLNMHSRSDLKQQLATSKL